MPASNPLPPARNRPAAVLGPLMRGHSVPVQPPLTCARQPTCAPAARRRRVGERPRMTRYRCRGARGCPCPLRHSVRRPVGPSMLPAHRPQRRLGRDLAPPGSRSDPASRPRGPTRCPDAALRTARAAPIGRRSAPERRPGAGRPWVSAPRTAESPRSARFPRPGSPAQRPRRGDQPWRAPGAAPRPCSAQQRPAGARSGLRRRA